MFRIVLADDEPKFRRWLRSLLDDNQNFQVLGEAGSGREALKLVELLSPDLVLTDLHMPNLDGLEVARYIRQHFPCVKVILISAYDDRIHERLAVENGALAFIPKVNLTPDALCRLLQRGK